MVGKKLIGAAIAAVLPLVVLTCSTTASATTAAPVIQAASNNLAMHAAMAHPAAVTQAVTIPNNACWAVSADLGNEGNEDLYIIDSGLHNKTTVSGTYNACFYFSENGSTFDGYPVMQMFINPRGADCEKVVYPDTVPAALYDEPCDDQHSGDPGESFIVFPNDSGAGGYVIESIEDFGQEVAVSSFTSGATVEINNAAAPRNRFWGLYCETDC
jgi:hypothetical protein